MDEHNVVTTKQLVGVGIPRSYIHRLCAKGTLERAGYGRYRAKRAEDERSKAA